MMDDSSKLVIVVKKGRHKIVSKTPLDGIGRFVFVYNNQYTNAPNTTQIASGAGRNSASGNNAAIDSPWTRQQHSVGADGKARNTGFKGRPFFPPVKAMPGSHGQSGREVVVVFNNQIVKLRSGRGGASATQIASGAGSSSTGGTNSAIASPYTRQQQAVAGGPGSRATNRDKGSGRSKRRRRSGSAFGLRRPRPPKI